MSEYVPHYYPNRSICSMLEDLRTAHKVRNYSYLDGLIEEIQWAGNRMEAAISDQQDIHALREERSKLKNEVRKLREEKKSLTEKE
jgi:hypothetical protein